MNVAIPDGRRAEAQAVAARSIPAAPGACYPLVTGMRAAAGDDTELILSNTWRPTLLVIGAAGLPEPAQAGNVLRAWTSLTLSFRIPPTASAKAAADAVTRTLTTDVPYGATVELSDVAAEDGWNAPAPHRGCPPRWTRPTAGCSARRTAAWASAGRYRSWRCSAGATRRPRS